LSDEFVDVILGKLVEALRPGLYDQFEEATLNAALATIDSMQPRSELQALLAVQVIATGFAGLRFLRKSHRHMTEDYINLYDSSRRNGWRHSRSRISGMNPHPRTLSRGGECSKPPLGTSWFYGCGPPLWWRSAYNCSLTSF
jgi:hypothetical protein